MFKLTPSTSEKPSSPSTKPILKTRYACQLMCLINWLRNLALSRPELSAYALTTVEVLLNKIYVIISLGPCCIYKKQTRIIYNVPVLPIIVSERNITVFDLTSNFPVPVSNKEIQHKINAHQAPFNKPLTLVRTTNSDLDLYLECLEIPSWRQDDLLLLNPVRKHSVFLAYFLSEVATYDFNLLPAYNIPQVGNARPLLHCIGMDRSEIHPRALNLLMKGLNFVPAIDPLLTRDIYDEIFRQVAILPCNNQTVGELCELLSKNRSNKTKLSQGFDKRDLNQLSLLSKQTIIKPSDKGGRIVIMSKEFYKSKVLKLIECPDYTVCHNRISLSDLTTIICNKLRTVSKKCRQIPIKENLRRVINETRTQDSRIGLFYGLPKIHKNLLDPPMRPVVSQTNHPTAPLARYIDKIIQRYIYKYNPHLLKSTDHALSCIKQVKGSNIKIITLDVKSLYTSIPLEEGITALNVESALIWRTSYDERLILDEIPLVLNNNYFEFDDVQYRQLKGVAMGSPLGPSFANTFMLYIDRLIMQMDGVRSFYRYIDDILIICELDLVSGPFLKYCNSINESIQFEIVDDGLRAEFLDLSLQVDGNTINYTLFEKNISSWDRYIDRSSLHHIKLLKGLAIGAFKRTFKLCSNILSAGYHINNTVVPRLKEKGLVNNYDISLALFRTSSKVLFKYKKLKPLFARLILDLHPDFYEDGLIIKEWCKEISRKINYPIKIQLVYKGYKSLRKYTIRAAFNSRDYSSITSER